VKLATAVSMVAAVSAPSAPVKLATAVSKLTTASVLVPMLMAAPAPAAEAAAAVVTETELGRAALPCYRWRQTTAMETAAAPTTASLSTLYFIRNSDSSATSGDDSSSTGAESPTTPQHCRIFGTHFFRYEGEWGMKANGACWTLLRADPGSVHKPSVSKRWDGC
jgi:hypothetical protein